MMLGPDTDIGDILGDEQEVPTDREHDRILKEIETTETAFVGASLRAVYEGGDHGKFLDKLSERIGEHDRDIERLCNFHYHGFIESITELLKVRSDADALRKQVGLLNTELQESGKELTKRCEDLIQNRLQQRNISSAIDELTQCMPVLQMYAKMQDQMNSGRYYSALKTLEELEQTQLPSVHNYRFFEIMTENIPRTREHIKETSMSNIKGFLEVVRQNEPKIGMLAMRQVGREKGLDSLLEPGIKSGTVEKYNLSASPTEADMHWMEDKERFKKSKKDAKKRKKHKIDPGGRTNPFDESDGESDGSNPFANPKSNVRRMLSSLSAAEDDSSLTEVVDFSPVYKCLHIFTILNSVDQFERYYREQRENQAVIVLQPPANMHECLEKYESFFHQVAGFFVVEDYILHTAPELVDRSFVDGLWDMASSEIISILRNESDYGGSSDIIISVKYLIVLFADTLRAYGYETDHVFRLLIELKEQYCEILLKEWGEVFQAVFDDDNYTPMRLEGESEAAVVLSVYPCEELESAKLVFPKRLPFSEFVPKIFNEIKNFITACLKFCEDLHLSLTELDDMLRKSTNLLLTRTLGIELTKLVQKPMLGLTELVQITINTSYLEQSCKHIEEFVHSITGVDSSASHTAKLVGVSTFRDARCEAEAQIYVKVNNKVDEFFELAEYDWTITEPCGRASSYLLDLVAFLKDTFKVFTHLPENVAQTSCMSACKHIAARMMGLLLDKSTKYITMAALQQFSLDLMQCELFSESEPVPGFEDGVLQMTFHELRQLLDLFLSWDWSCYLADYGSGGSNYARVNPAAALSLLERIREDHRHRNIFTSLSRREREKKKLLETVLKQLRNIVNDWTLLCVPYNKLNKGQQSHLLAL